MDSLKPGGLSADTDVLPPAELLAAVQTIRQRAVEHAATFPDEFLGVPAKYRTSAQNLLHYLALRQQDIRDLQRQLALRGLSSLGRAEGHVLATLDSVIAALDSMAHAANGNETAAAQLQRAAASQELERNATQLLGCRHKDRPTRIMVTMPTEAAGDYRLVRDLLDAGTDVMRINCAHDDAGAWGAMIEHLSRARRDSASTCKVLMDLGGPKLRTGPVSPGPQLVRVRAVKDARGNVQRPVRVWLFPATQPISPPAAAEAELPLDEFMLVASRAGDVFDFTDSRGKSRSFTVVESVGNARWVIVDKSAYLETGSLVRLTRGETRVAETFLGPLPALDNPLRLRVGDLLRVTRGGTAGENASGVDGGHPAHISCLEDRVFAEVQTGERVFFDDGKISGLIIQTAPDYFTVQIAQAGKNGSRLTADKGINLPDSELTFSALQDKDIRDLEFVAAHADLVGLSFVHRPEEVQAVRKELVDRGRPDLGIILKIETRRAFEQLPRLLIAALRHMPAGVMVARGDLGVEMGFDRLAEVQEEILWLCEAAHLPVIWATQVLETMTKKGRPTRAEVTDAAMSVRAECVMLNKGPHLTEAVHFLSHVLQRMHDHQEKKNAMLRKLSISQLTGSRTPQHRSTDLNRGPEFFGASLL
jgi:pyruvate kinase